MLQLAAALNHQWTTLDLFGPITTPHHVLQIPRLRTSTGLYIIAKCPEGALDCAPKSTLGIHSRHKEKVRGKNVSEVQHLSMPTVAPLLETNNTGGSEIILLSFQSNGSQMQRFASISL